MSERFGGSQLSVVWTAPEFEAALHEAYFVCVLEMPTLG